MTGANLQTGWGKGAGEWKNQDSIPHDEQDEEQNERRDGQVREQHPRRHNRPRSRRHNYNHFKKKKKSGITKKSVLKKIGFLLAGNPILLEKNLRKKNRSLLLHTSSRIENEAAAGGLYATKDQVSQRKHVLSNSLVRVVQLVFFDP